VDHTLAAKCGKPVAPVRPALSKYRYLIPVPPHRIVAPMSTPRKIIARLGCAAAIALVALPGAARADMKSGIAAYKAGDFKTAHSAFAKEAAKGNAIAQFNLAVLYLTGRGVARGGRGHGVELLCRRPRRIAGLFATSPSSSFSA